MTTKKTPPPEEPLAGQISLDEYLNQLDGPIPETDATADDMAASRMLRELATMEKAIEANASMAEAERAKISQWETTVNEPLQNRALWLRSQLEAYAVRERQTHDRKTISLPFGTLTTRPANAVWEITDKFIEWAKLADPDLLRVKYEADKTAVKSKFVADSDGDAVDPGTGVIIPGVHVVVSAEYIPSVKTNR